MVDTLLANGFSAANRKEAIWGPYSISPLIGVFVTAVVNDSKVRAVAYQTLDGGVTWDAGTILDATPAVSAGQLVQLACYADTEVPGDDGLLLHVAMAFNDISEARYRTINIETLALGTLRTVASAVFHATNENNRISVAKARNGDLMVAWLNQTDLGCRTSSDGGETWDVADDVFEVIGDEDWCLLYPADVDAGDFAALYWDLTFESKLSLKMYDASLNTWTETAISADTFTFNQLRRPFDGAIRHSDGHLLFAAWTQLGQPTADFRAFDLTVDSIGAPTIDEKTAVETDLDKAGHAGIQIDQQTDDVRFVYLFGTSVGSALDCYTNVSHDGMATWEGKVKYNEAVIGDLRGCSAGRSVTVLGGRFQPAFYNDDLDDFFVNLNNDVEIAAAGAAAGGTDPQFVDFPSSPGIAVQHRVVST